MGSPPTETERTAADRPRGTMVIPRRYAIATKEVTVSQFQWFLSQARITLGRYRLATGSLQKYSPDPDGPWLAPQWYVAAHYCNWLSEQEGIPRDQWCYIPAPGGAYDEGMTAAANILERTGYRLPTEAEWEFACRAGTTTARYYGTSIDLLAAYAHYQANSEEHAWPAADLMPNELGLFDMLGNAEEWTHDSFERIHRRRHAVSFDDIRIIAHITHRNDRLLRGGSIFEKPPAARSASRRSYPPASSFLGTGFRVVKTHK